MRPNQYKKKKESTKKECYHHEKGSLCQMCNSELEWISRDNRNLTNLEGKTYLSINVSRCSNSECINHKKRLKPVSYLNQIVPGSGYGVDVYGLIGHLRLSNHRTVVAIN